MVLCDELVGWDQGVGGRSTREGIYVIYVSSSIVFDSL